MDGRSVGRSPNAGGGSYDSAVSYQIADTHMHTHRSHALSLSVSQLATSDQQRQEEIADSNSQPSN